MSFGANSLYNVIFGMYPNYRILVSKGIWNVKKYESSHQLTICFMFNVLSKADWVCCIIVNWFLCLTLFNTYTVHLQYCDIVLFGIWDMHESWKRRIFIIMFYAMCSCPHQATFTHFLDVYYAVQFGSNFESADEILNCNHSNEVCWAVLFCGIAY